MEKLPAHFWVLLVAWPLLVAGLVFHEMVPWSFILLGVVIGAAGMLLKAVGK